MTIHTTLLGGGLGRKAEIDFIAQAVQVGMALQRPVQLVWPREEDFTHDQYRPMARGARARRPRQQRLRRRLGLPQRLAVDPRRSAASVLGAKGDSQGYEASQRAALRLRRRLVEWVSHPSPIPVGFWRSVGASINTFAVESMIDELAAAAGQDPYQFRRARLTDPRWLAVLEAAAALGNWSTKPPAGTRARHRHRHGVQQHRGRGGRGVRHQRDVV